MGVSGLAGLLQYNLSVWAAGTCTTASASEVDTCSHGHWELLNKVMLVMLLSLIYFPYQDHLERIHLSLSRNASLKRFPHLPPSETIPYSIVEQVGDSIIGDG